MRTRQKVFGIGFHKTATSSLGNALGKLGYKVSQGFGFGGSDIESKILQRALERAEVHDAFEDNPWPILYKEMDKAFPGSKFIATWRDPEAWFSSVERHFGRDSTRMREWIYGSGYGAPAGNRKVYVERYSRHYRDVDAYFKDRPADYLKLDIDAGLGWSDICAFLGTPEPDADFPMANVGAEVRGPIRTALRQSVLGSAIRKLANSRRSSWT